MRSIPLRMAAAASVTLWTVAGGVLLVRPIAFYGAALSLYYPGWWTNGLNGVSPIQASPVYTTVAVLFGCVLLALATIAVFLYRHKKQVELFLFLLAVHLWICGGSAALLTRAMFDPMRPFVLVVLFFSALNVFVLSCAKTRKTTLTA